MDSRLQYANTELTSPYYINYSYIIQPSYCEGTLRNFDPIKNYFLFSPLYAKTNLPILVPIAYLQCVEERATKCIHGHIFNLLYRDWMAINLTIASPHRKRFRSSAIFSRYSPTLTYTPVRSLLVWRVIRNFWHSSAIQTIERRTSSSSTGKKPQPYTIHRFCRPSNPRLTVLEKLTQFFLYFLNIFLIYLLFNYLSSFIQLKIKIISFLLPPGWGLLKEGVKFD